MIRRIAPVASLAVVALCAFVTPGSASAQTGFARGGDNPTPYAKHWYYKANDPTAWNRLTRLVGSQAPELQVKDWIGDERKPADLEGKIVVLDFWGTWCAPCIQAIPKNNKTYEAFKDHGVEFIGVCESQRPAHKTMQEIVNERNIKYPTAKDVGGRTVQSYDVMWFPFYVIIDRKGVIRAAGLQPQFVSSAVKQLIDEEQAQKTNDADAATAKEKDFPAGLLEGSLAKQNRFNDIRGETPPPITVTNWTNSDAIDLDSLKGKVVLVDFWATWCGPCKKAVPHTNELARKHAKDGLVVIGICATRGADTMSQVVEQLGIEYPVCADVNNRTVSGWRVDGFPDYFLIDRKGRLRAPDVKNGHVDQAIEMLLAEES